MSDDLGDLFRDLRDTKREMRARFGVPCPECVAKLPKACPSILLPQQTCRIHRYRDPRSRTDESSYLKKGTP
jgi:hypothetical protein